MSQTFDDEDGFAEALSQHQQAYPSEDEEISPGFQPQPSSILFSPTKRKSCFKGSNTPTKIRPTFSCDMRSRVAEQRMQGKRLAENSPASFLTKLQASSPATYALAR